MTTAPTRLNGRQPDGRDQRKDRHPQDVFRADSSGLAPLCDEPEFAVRLAGMVADEAPRLFAVVQEYGERIDGRIAAWGMAFADHAEVISMVRRRWMSLRAPDDALRIFTFGDHIRARLVWFGPDLAIPSGDDNVS